MTTTSAVAGLTPQQWDDKFFTSYVRANPFARYMGMSEYDKIQVKQDMQKKNGDSVTYALVNDLTGDGKTGSTVLKGYEEEMKSRSFKVGAKEAIQPLLPLLDDENTMVQETVEAVLASFGWKPSA